MNKYGRDIDKWKDLPPAWCKNTEVWALLCDEWKRPEWQEVSMQNSENRMAGDNVVHHLSGSASAYRHAKKLVLLFFIFMRYLFAFL